MTRQQLPPQIKKIEVLDRKTGKTVVRYQLTVDAGIDPVSGQRRQVRRRYATEKLARDGLSEVTSAAATGSFVPRKAVTVEELARRFPGLAAPCPRHDDQRLWSTRWPRSANGMVASPCRS